MLCETQISAIPTTSTMETISASEDNETVAASTATLPSGGALATDTDAVSPAAELTASSSSPLQIFGTLLGGAIQGLLDLVGQLASIINATPQSPPPAVTPKPNEPDNTEPSSNTSPNTLPLKESGEFLWKPVSEKDSNLVVLCRSALTGRIKNVKVLDPSTHKTLAKGKPAGVGNGNREHFRFNKPGSAFPDGSIVQITLKNGDKRTVVIKETSERFIR